MALNQEIIRKVAMGDKATLEELSKQPVTMRMAYGIAANELRKKENIVPAGDNMNFIVREERDGMDRDKAGEALAKIMQQRKENEEHMAKVRQEILEKQAKQMAERARALGSWQ